MKSKEEIFDTLISENLGMLRAAAYRILGNHSEVDDAVQEALLIAWNKYSRFRATSKLSSWVYRITVNHCCDRLRKQNREVKKLTAFAELQPQTLERDDTAQLEALRIAVSELPSMYKESILLGCLGEVSSEEAAAKLDCSVNTLYQRIHKAKQMLKKKLEGIL